MSGFKFGDLVYHKGEKCVYMGKLPPQIGSSEVLFEGDVRTTNVADIHLSKELPPIRFVGCDGVCYSVGLDNGMVVIDTDSDYMEFASEDIDSIIDCLNQVKERYCDK